MGSTRFKDKGLTSVVKVNSPIYVFEMPNDGKPFGTYYYKGDIVYDAETEEFWRLDEDARPFMTLGTINKTLFCMSPCGGGGGEDEDVKVSLFDGDVHGYLTQKLIAGTGISLTVTGVAPNQHLVIDNTYTSVETFLELLDTPDTYVSKSQWIVRVRTDELGLEFVDPVTAFDDKFVKTSLLDPIPSYLLDKIQAGTNITFTEVPVGGGTGNYITIDSTNTLPTGFEYRGAFAGDGAGWSLINRIEANYSVPGNWALDASFASGVPGFTGAVADASAVFGFDNEANGWGSGVGGYLCKTWANASTAFTWGYDVQMVGYASAGFGLRNRGGLAVGESATWTGYLLAPLVVNGFFNSPDDNSYGDYNLISGNDNIVITDSATVSGSNNYVYDDVVNLGYLFVAGSSNKVSARYSSVFGFGNIVEAEGGFVSGQNIHIEKIVPGSIATNDQSKMNFVGGWGKYTPTWANTWNITVRGHANMVWTDARTRDVALYAYDSALIGGSDVQIFNYHWNNVYLGLVNRDDTDILWDDHTIVENLSILTQPPAYGPSPTSVPTVLARHWTGEVREISLTDIGGYHKYFITDNSFSLGQALSFYGGAWQQADTSTEERTAQGIVIKIQAGIATLIRYGEFVLPSHGYTIGSWYYLSNTGTYSPYTASQAIQQIMFFVKDVHTLHLHIEQPTSGVSSGTGTMSWWTYKQGVIVANIEDEMIVEFEAGAGIVLGTQTILGTPGGRKLTIEATGTGVDTFDALTDTVGTKGDFGDVVEVVDDGGGGKELGYNKVPEINTTDDTLAGRMAFAVVSSMPGTPDPNTVYFIEL